MPRLFSFPPAGLSAPLRPGRRVVSDLVDRARHWPVESQQAARRNAMLACTDLTVRRAEREDVEEFFRTLSDPPAAAHG